ncbi:SAM-dependent methyltransferase [Corallococcus sp. H22C18031201]|uniref:bifunctional glycosyltransferase/class I SAM-dependent methyltransferase n=1 Tax=Citreicoccus inhibens TaxID=2849499 RepID=UPI000E75CCB2|nr:bifunctional glycosyltransferase/class I SAM-dependent methyltransferase [Citreicoccus inhibens]MBU8896345.1 methyltransferase domain-containing protein [Citreicoccus inhibens]RJS17332.1 SAM-dependent methyltransferase [Corallococcus sp. H22C18031201]
MSLSLSVILPYDASTAGAAARFARALSGKAQVLLAGDGPVDVPPVPGVEGVIAPGGKGAALRAALPRVTGDVTVVQDPDVAYALEAYDTLVRPILDDTADGVFGRRPGLAPELWADRALGGVTRFVTDVPLTDPLTGLRAFRTEALRAIQLTSDDEAVDAELVVKLAAQLFRLTEVSLPPLQGTLKRPVATHLARLRTLMRYATVRDDADNQHEGYSTLERMDGATHYNQWLGRRFREHLGRRVLEIGAGIGTITRELESGAELLVALEVERFYVDRLKNMFRGKPHVRPYLSDVALADWESLKAEQLDTIVLSNVLEHIPDDAAAVRRFRQILAPGGRVLILVPALPALFGAIDEAVGHYRRYTPDSLRAVLEGNGFELEKLEWMNLVGLPGWFLNSRILRRRAVPKLQLRVYDALAPLFAQAERNVKLPVGMSLFAVARVTGDAAP